MRLLLLFGAVATVSGCRFWYKPVPVANAIGEEKAFLAGDSVNVHREARFELYGPNVEAVYDGYEQLNRAYRAFDRHFGAPAPKLAVILSRDTSHLLDDASVRTFRDRGFSVVQYVRPRGARRRPGMAYGGTLWPLAPTAAHAMLTRFAGMHVAADRSRSDASLLEKFPLWLRAATIHLVGEAGSAANDLSYMRDKRGEWMPLRDLLTFTRPSADDATLDPSRRGDSDDFSRLFAAQSTMFAHFLVEHEGPDVLGRLARGYLAGRSLGEMIAEFKSAPHTVPELDQRFKVWIETREN